MRLVLLELSYELDCTLEDASFIFLATRYDFGKLVDAFIDGFAAATFDYKERVLDHIGKNRVVGGFTFFMVVSADLVPFISANGGLIG